MLDVGRFLVDDDLEVLDRLVVVLLGLVRRGDERVQAIGLRVLGDQVLDDLARLGVLAALLQLDRLAPCRPEARRSGRRPPPWSASCRSAGCGLVKLESHPLRLEAFLEELEVPIAGRRTFRASTRPCRWSWPRPASASPAFIARTRTAGAGFPWSSRILPLTRAFPLDWAHALAAKRTQRSISAVFRALIMMADYTENVRRVSPAKLCSEWPATRAPRSAAGRRVSSVAACARQARFGMLRRPRGRHRRRLRGLARAYSSAPIGGRTGRSFSSSSTRCAPIGCRSTAIQQDGRRCSTAFAQRGCRVRPGVRARAADAAVARRRCSPGTCPSSTRSATTSDSRLRDGTPTLAAMFQAAGYGTGAFVSAYVLRPETGVGQGFDVYDATFPPMAADRSVAQVQRPGPQTLAAAEAWLEDADVGSLLSLPAPLRAAQAVSRAGALRAIWPPTTARSRSPTRSSGTLFARLEGARLVRHARRSSCSRITARASATTSRKSTGCSSMTRSSACRGSCGCRARSRRDAACKDPVQHIDLLPTLAALARPDVPAGPARPRSFGRAVRSRQRWRRRASTPKRSIRAITSGGASCCR